MVLFQDLPNILIANSRHSANSGQYIATDMVLTTRTLEHLYIKNAGKPTKINLFHVNGQSYMLDWAGQIIVSETTT